MAGGMKYNFTAVDGATAQIGGMISAMEQNLANLRSLKANLESITAGDMSTAASSIWTKFNTDMQNYESTMRSVARAISTTSGSSGDMRNVDIAQGNRFLSIG
ncbi:MULTISPECIES: hypothetical protein [unclassified Nocardia]|uniref:WXG100 family type VII secretion target n=1 Tax=unclassified Nocardia TaxID=2637762 RepID=UPI0024A7B787|nr:MULTISPECIES: hypothetical protein [unclassified Nocardia]